MEQRDDGAKWVALILVALTSRTGLIGFLLALVLLAFYLITRVCIVGVVSLHRLIWKGE